MNQPTNWKRIARSLAKKLDTVLAGKGTDDVKFCESCEQQIRIVLGSNTKPHTKRIEISDRALN